MKSNICLGILCVWLCCPILFAQDDNYYEENVNYKGSNMSGLKLGLNVQLVTPLNRVVSQYFGGGTGLGLYAKYIFADKFGLGGLFNYHLISNRVATVGQTNTLMMYGVSLDYFVYKAKITPYFGIDFCDYRFTGEYSLNTGGTVNSFQFDYYLLSGWGVAPNIGFIYDFTERVSTTVNFKYNHVFPRDLMGINAQLLMISASVFYNIGEL